MGSSTTSTGSGIPVLNVDSVSFDTSAAMDVGLLVLTAVAVLWGVRKAISMANRG